LLLLSLGRRDDGKYIGQLNFDDEHDSKYYIENLQITPIKINTSILISGEEVQTFIPFLIYSHLIFNIYDWLAFVFSGALTLLLVG